jgi:hypothetical protein
MRTGFYLLAAAAFICSVALLLVRYRQLQQEAAWDAGLAAERSRGGSDGGSPVEDAADVALKGVPCPDPNLYPPSHKSTGAGFQTYRRLLDGDSGLHRQLVRCLRSGTSSWGCAHPLKRP